MSTLGNLLDGYRSAAMTEREKGTYFEELMLCYLRNEATYKDLYDKVWTYADWAREQALDKRDAGIDLVARTSGTNEYHAIQCKLYADDYRLQKVDIDSFFTASGKKPFTHRIIVSTTNHWSEHAEDALRGQQPPVSKIDLHDLENSQIDWAKYQPRRPASLKTKKSLRPHQKTAVDAVLTGLLTADRGKLIMACGTGKTLTSLRIAEALAGKGKRVLFLVPSLALLSQSLTEWTQEGLIRLHSFAVCSDSDVGKKRSNRPAARPWLASTAVEAGGFVSPRPIARCRVSLQRSVRTRMPLTQVTGVLGLSEQSVLTRSCLRWFGRTPSAIRNSNRT
jgi:predicted helicase